MNKLKDEVHDCINCGIYPCSLQEDISDNDICKNCPTTCCREVLVVILPCESGKLKEGKLGLLKMNEDGWCYYFDHNTRSCSIYEKRPIACRVASCRFIREGKIPEMLKKLDLNKSFVDIEEM
jgi:Fe-S-cluster containining protein